MFGLLVLAFNNVWNDLVENVYQKSPISVIIQPENFEPPFTNAFNTFFNITAESGTNFVYSGSKLPYLNIIISVFSVILAELDIIYCIIRLAIATGLILSFVGLAVFFMIWCYITLYRRWSLLITFVKSDKFNNGIS
ncbi:hypothetical protein DFJ63DRAFT_313342 [Scheffersomyces coipomensis]|uniref:uncharacterized protein n=1 Tax=Scheffersomyces coipomensis TaxID=1788519 RepID=UPI00315D4EBC